MPDTDTPVKRGKKTAQTQPEAAPQNEVVVQLPLSELHDFPNHPFKVRDDESMWSQPGDLERFQRILVNIGLRKKRDTPQFFAALYLLSANEDIWHRAYNCFSKKELSFDYLRMSGISVQGYALVQAAKAIYLNNDGFTIADLEDCDAVNTDTFALIINAILIAAFGMGVTKIRREKCLS